MNLLFWTYDYCILLYTFLWLGNLNIHFYFIYVFKFLDCQCCVKFIVSTHATFNINEWNDDHITTCMLDNITNLLFHVVPPPCSFPHVPFNSAWKCFAMRDLVQSSIGLCFLGKTIGLSSIHDGQSPKYGKMKQHWCDIIFPPNLIGLT